MLIHRQVEHAGHLVGGHHAREVRDHAGGADLDHPIVGGDEQRPVGGAGQPSGRGPHHRRAGLGPGHRPAIDGVGAAGDRRGQQQDRHPDPDPPRSTARPHEVTYAKPHPPG